MVEKIELKISLFFGILVTVLTFFFIPLFAQLYGIEANLIGNCSKIIRTICPIFVIIAVVSNFDSYVTTINRFKISYILCILENVFLVLFSYIGSKFNILGIFIGYSASYIVLLIFISFIMIKSGSWLLPKTKDDGFVDYSIVIDKEQIVQVSTNVQQLALENGYSPQTAMKFSLLMEDGLNLIRLKNPDYFIEADIRVKVKNDKLIIAILDNGVPYNLSASLSLDSNQEELEQLILSKVSSESIYDRVLELNHLVLKLSIQK